MSGFVPRWYEWPPGPAACYRKAICSYEVVEQTPATADGRTFGKTG
ncbi:hypothetical protein CJF32_00005341 [Rutstroemia sp. NJR-2017a WRK4]|nr:hypothetical protein CJF32_00005341 [Rutstroemia sp. NJR-2017a WRK4]